MTTLPSSPLLSALANHLWQSTLFVGVVAILTLAMRRNRARIRHAMWFAASVKLAVPFSVLVALGGTFEWPRTAPALQPGPNFFAITRIVVEPVVASGADPSPGVLARIAALSWLSGFAIVLTAWYRTWRRSLGAVRSAERGTEPVPGWADVRTTTDAAAPAVFGVVRPVLLLPARIQDRLNSEELSAVIAHERAHVDRHDNLTTAFHRVVTAVFWFHPFVWWIGKRLIDERERASDEAAVAAGFSPDVYVEGLLKVCRSAVGAPLACVAGIRSSNLKVRVEGIMKYDQIRKLHPVLRIAIGVFVILSLIGPVIAGLSNNPPPGVFRQTEASEPVPAASQDTPAEDSSGSGALERWLDQDVAYIITDEERTAYEGLATDGQREDFIETFWLRRDPTPPTPENEYREEHYRRIAHTNRQFSFGETSGWQSDRGRIYVVYGEPASSESGVSGAGQPASFAFERWRYRYIEGLGQNVDLTFVDVNRTGEYRLQVPEGAEANLVEPAALQGAAALAELDAFRLALSPDGGPYRIEDGVVPPRILERVQPTFPQEARQSRVEGTVVLEAIVRRDGSIEVERVVTNPGSGLHEAAAEAIRQWRFIPGTLDGEPVDVALKIEVSFNLR